MNTCILMAEIVKEPELRYTPDNQTPIAEMLVQFPGMRPDDPPSTLKVVGWGNLAQEIQSNYHEGDRVVIEGRLMINTIDRPEGFKEKRAELTAQRVHRLGSDAIMSTSSSMPNSTSAQSEAPTNGTSAPRTNSSPKAKTQPAKFATATPDMGDPLADDIPF